MVIEQNKELQMFFEPQNKKKKKKKDKQNKEE
jgi:hypothetical protein